MEVMTFWTLVTGTGWLLLSRWSELSSIRWDAIELQTIIAIGYLAVFATLITFLLGQRAVVVIGPTRMMAYAYLNPALVGLITWVLGEGAVGWAAVPGIALTLAAMISLQRHTSAADADVPWPLHVQPKGAA
jgi:drug/metabolite transporter (DMT)-like permease